MKKNKTPEQHAEDLDFLEYAHEVATSSHDSKTQVGAVVLKGHQLLATGYNAFPPAYNYGPIDMQSDFKHPRIVHAEMRAFLSCFDPDCMRGATLYVTHSPCPDCAKHIAMVGIRRVVFRAYKGLGLDLLAEFGVDCEQVVPEAPKDDCDE